MAEDAAELRKILQANLESVVNQLEVKTKECDGMTKEVATQQALVVQLTKKLDVVSKRNKQVEKENARFVTARDELVSAETQTDPDALLLDAYSQLSASQAETRAARARGEAELNAAQEAAAAALAAAKAEAQTDLDAAKAAAAEAAARATELTSKLEAAEASAASAAAALEARDTAAKEEVAKAAAGFAAELAQTKDRLRKAAEGESAAVKAGQAYVAKLQGELREAHAAAEAAKKESERAIQSSAATHAATHSATEEEIATLRAKLVSAEQKHLVMASTASDQAEQLAA